MFHLKIFFLIFTNLAVSVWASDVDMNVDIIIGQQLVKQYKLLAEQPLYTNSKCVDNWIKSLAERCRSNASETFLEREAARFMHCHYNATGIVAPSCVDGVNDKSNKTLSPTRCLLLQGMSELNLKIWAATYTNIRPLCMFFIDARLEWHIRLLNGFKRFANTDVIADFINNSTFLQGTISQIVYVADYKHQFNQYRLIAYVLSFIVSCVFAAFVNLSLLAMVISCCFVELFVFICISSEYSVAMALRSLFFLATAVVNRKYLARLLLYFMCDRQVVSTR